MVDFFLSKYENIFNLHLALHLLRCGLAGYFFLLRFQQTIHNILLLLHNERESVL